MQISMGLKTLKGVLSDYAYNYLLRIYKLTLNMEISRTEQFPDIDNCYHGISSLGHPYKHRVLNFINGFTNSLLTNVH